MRMKLITWLFLSVLVSGGAVLLSWWIGTDPVMHLAESVPGMDGRPVRQSAREFFIRIGEFGMTFDAAHASLSDGRTLPGEWPRFRGPRADNVSTADAALADQWGPEGPEVLWSVDLGEGHAAPAVLNGRVYILDYDETRRADALRCFSLENGSELWRRWYTVPVKRNHGMSRTIPAVTDRFVVTIGPRCHVMCVDALSGDFLWGIDLEKDYETEVPLWYTGQCPLIDGSTAVIAPGGRTLLIGVDCATGEVVWETPNPHGWQMSHSSVMPMTLNGLRMYVYCALGGVVGVAAEGDIKGQVLWETDSWSPNVAAPSPVIFDDGRIFLTAGYGYGSAMLQVRETDGSYAVETLYRLSPKEGLACEQQTPFLYQGYLFGVLPKDAGDLRNQFVCYDPEGSMTWTSGKTKRFGLGPFLAADDKFYVLSDDGVLTMLEASTREYLELDRARILDGQDSWGPIALAGGRMLLRDSRRMVCIDVSQRN
jgi:outer membrane protein assembly factor BamB